jgi:putative membrane protein
MTNRLPRAAIAVLAAAAASFIAVAAAPAASAATTPSGQDTLFLKSNEQVNLAEITIGQLALQRATTQSARSVATQTVSDHQKAKAKLTALAASVHVSLPTVPNAQQQAQAATLKTVATSKFDVAYLQIQVAGHQMSIAATNKEIVDGSNASVIAYANYYLPVATMHLAMAQAGLSALTGAPLAVPAGSGGEAAVTGSSRLEAAWWTGGLGLLFAVGAGFGLMRRRPSAR